MFKYRKVKVPVTKSDDSELRVSNAKPAREYLCYVYGLFEEKKQEFIILRANGFAIQKGLGVALLIRRHIKGLYMIIEFGNREITDKYEPLEEGLDNVTVNRSIPFVTVRFSLKQLDKAHPGYSDPLPESEVTPFDPSGSAAPRPERFEGESRGPLRSRGRGFRSPRQYDDYAYSDDSEGHHDELNPPRRFRGVRYGGRFGGRPRYNDYGRYGKEEYQGAKYYEGERPRRLRRGGNFEDDGEFPRRRSLRRYGGPRPENGQSQPAETEIEATQEVHVPPANEPAVIEVLTTL
jgi:hypothetical protein